MTSKHEPRRMLLGFSRVEAEILAALWLSTFVCMADTNIIPILLDNMNETFNVGLGLVGAVVKSTHAIGAVVGSLLCGPLSDRYGRYHFLFYGSVVFALFSVLTWLSPDAHVLLPGLVSGASDPEHMRQIIGFVALSANRAVVGFATGALTINSIAFLADVIPYHRRGVAMGVYMCGTFSGMIVGLPLAAFLVLWWHSWRATFLLFGLLSLVSAVSIWWLLSHQQHFGREARSRQEGSTVLWALSNYRRLIARGSGFPAMLTIALSTTGMYGILTYLPAYLDKFLGFSDVRTSLLFAAVAPVSLASALGSGWLADKTSKRGVVLAASFCLFAVVLAFPSVLSSVPLICLAFVVAAAAGAARMGPVNALLSGLAPVTQRSSIFALRNGASFLGVTVGSIMGGIIYGQQESAAGFSRICYTSSVILVISFAVVYFGLPEPTGTDEEVLVGIASESEVVS